MSVKPSPEEPTIPSDATGEGKEPEAPATEDNQPQAGANAGEAPAATEAEPTAEATGQAAEPGTPEASAADARIQELEAQVADLTDRLLRAHAELDNFRKRTEREKAEIAKYAIAKFAADVAVLTDNFQRALSSVQLEGDEPNPQLKGLVEGVTMMEREFLNVLERHGVKRIEADGQPFNPHVHEAVMEQHNPDVPSGTIVQVFQQGYMIEDRVLRPAMVVVAKGGPKAQPAAEKPAETQAQATAPETESQPQQAGTGDNTGNNQESSGSGEGEGQT